MIRRYRPHQPTPPSPPDRSVAAGPSLGENVAVNPPTANWWRTAAVYQIYPRSFADASGDGIGDLPGITSRLGALTYLGVDAVWISPFYRSPQVDAGYDVSDYRDVDPLFGTLADFDELVTRCHVLGLKVIIDLVPNHSSDDHPWFQAALAAAAGSAARSRYLFRDGKGTHGDQPPNNWRSIMGGPAWTRITGPDGCPGQWYLHIFDARQPDFDWTSPDVHAEFRSILRFWLDRGVDGFRVDCAHSLVKETGLPDEPEHAIKVLIPGEVGEADAHSPMWGLDGVHEIYREWRRVLDEYSPTRIMVAEATVSPMSRVARFVRSDEMHQAFNFSFLTAPWTATAVRQVIDRSLAANGAVGAPTTWVLSNHDVLRHVSRYGLPADLKVPNGIRVQDVQPDAALGLARGRAATLTMLALPGSAYLYQGEELGLPEHTALDDSLRQAPEWFRSGHLEAGRDGCRVPMPWNAAAPALGFSPTGASWLPHPQSYVGLAWDQQAGVAGSTLEMYRAALALRRSWGLAAGTLDWATDFADTAAEPDVLAFRNNGVLIVSNRGVEALPLPAGRVLLTSGTLDQDGDLPADVTAWIITD